MKKAFRLTSSTLAISLIIVLAGCRVTTKENAEPNQKTNYTSPPSTAQEWNPAEQELITLVEKLLFAVGNSDFETLESMVSDKANLASAIIRDEGSKNSIITIGEYFESQKNRERNPFYEPVYEYKILINKGQIAFVWADAILHSFGVPRTNNVDNFTLIKEEGKWKFINVSFTNTRLPEEQKKFDLEIFAKSYAQVWSGVRPEFVAMFFEENGSLKLNDGAPAEGRAAITEVAQGFMRDLPDMVVRYDSLVTKPSSTEFHFTLLGTNTGPGGTGNKVEVSGYEVWEMGENNRILNSQGHFPMDEYNRQLKFGIGN